MKVSINLEVRGATLDELVEDARRDLTKLLGPEWDEEHWNLELDVDPDVYTGSDEIVSWHAHVHAAPALTTTEKGTTVPKMTKKDRIDVAKEAMLWAIVHFEAMDSANAQMHCAPVRYSPITFRLAQAYAVLDFDSVQDRPLAVAEVLSHVDAYALDPGALMPLLNYTTTVPVNRSVAEVQSKLARAGARQIMTTYGEGATPIGIAFAVLTAHGMRNYNLPVQSAAVEKVLREDRDVANRYKTPEHAERVAWRIIKDWLEAQLAIVATGMVHFDEVMLPYMQGDDGRTIYQLYLDQQLALGSGS